MGEVYSLHRLLGDVLSTVNISVMFKFFFYNEYVLLYIFYIS